MESHTRAPSLPAPQTCRVIGKRRRIIDLSDTEEQEEVKRASSVIPSTTGDNGTSSTHHHTLRKEETTANSQNKTARDKRKRRKKRRKVSIVQEPSQPEKVEPEASQIASGSGLRRSPSLLSTIEIPDAVLGRTSGPIVVPTSADSSTDVAPTSFEVAESSRNATETVVKAESQSHSGEVGGHVSYLPHYRAHIMNSVPGPLTR